MGKGNLFFLMMAFSLWAISCSTNENQPIKSRPNILLVIADDLGYGDLGCYGGLSNTPNLDQLSANGLHFTDFYAAAPNCSPSRAGLLTGRSPSIVGIYNYRSVGHPMHLKDEEVTLAEVLKKENYQTVHIGKWHLGCLPQDPNLNHPQPDDQGFDYSLGTENNAEPSHLNPVNFVRNGVRLDTVKGYSCQILADETINWFDQKHDQSKPFFLYLPFHEPHAKIASPPELIAKYADHPPKLAEFYANIENLDLAFGRIYDYLEKRQLLENTLIIFSSDNGSYRLESNGGLRAVKSYVYEGGIRVPGIISWPSMIKEPKVINEPAGFVDVMPTILELLDIEMEEDLALDGTSILGLIKGQNFQREQPLYWHFYRTSPEMAMRFDQYKILGKDIDSVARTHPFSEPDMDYLKQMTFKEYELYDLGADKAEDRNFFSQHPDAEEFRQKIDAQLKNIQKKGVYWDSLPPANTKKKLKKDWRKYKR